jgi:glycosyltransferase
VKISLITATYNRADTIIDSLKSVDRQSYANYEHLIQDGGSKDDTLDVIQRHPNERRDVISEPDDGIYDALNKAFERSNGEIIGLLHSDDFLASDQVLSQVAEAFADPEIWAVYGDLHYVAKDRPDRIVRNWVSGEFIPKRLNNGWMPPHPALFLRRHVIETHGGYDTSFSIAADYDAILRYFGQPGCKAVYIPEVFVKMRVGGESNRSLKQIFRKMHEDYRALKKNKRAWMRALFFKNFGKLGQFVMT